MPTDNNELERYLAATPKSRELWEEAREYLPGGDSRNSIFWDPYPIFVESAAGSHVVDADGVDRLVIKHRCKGESAVHCFPQPSGSSAGVVDHRISGDSSYRNEPVTDRAHVSVLEWLVLFRRNLLRSSRCDEHETGNTCHSQQTESC